jgi:NitT/TauT family transport system substrate-binding protein
MMTTVKTFSIAICCLFSSMVLGSRSDAAEILLRVPIVYSSFTGAYVPLWIASEQKLGNKYGLDLTLVFAGRAKPQQMLLGGEAQYIFNTGTGTIDSFVHGVKEFVLIATIIRAPATSIIVARDISKPADLRGKIVGIGRIGSITDTLARYVIKTQWNLEPNRDVKILSMGAPDTILPALERGQIQAAVLTTPVRFVAKKMGFRELIDIDSLGVDYPNAGITTLRRNVKANPDLATKLAKILVEGIYIYKSNKETSIRIMRKYLRGVSGSILEETYNYFSKRALEVPQPSTKEVKNVLEMLSIENPDAMKLDPSEVIDASFVKGLDDSGFIKTLYK